MANRRRKKKHETGDFDHAGLSLQERYELALTNGSELSGVLSGKSISHVFPKNTIGYFLSAERQLKRIYNYYSREDIQREMFRYAEGRKITHLRLFRPQYERLIKPQDILPLVTFLLMKIGKYFPSLHGTISRYGTGGKRLSDAVIEIDYKASWKQCFEMTRPVVDMLKDRGAVFWLKFSGHSSVHVIIPAEALQIQGFSVDYPQFYRCLSDLIKKRLREPRYLDTSFYMYDHFLRLAYSVNENTGLVSLPFHERDYDTFDPLQAQPEKVKPVPGWWSMPKDAPLRMEEFIKYVMRGHVAASSESAEIKLPTVERVGGWQIDRKAVQRARQLKRQAMREFLPNEGFYDRMIRIGQDIIDLREFLLLEDRNSKTALRTIRHLHESGQAFDIGFIARGFSVDESDLRMLWKWEQNERAFRYYAQEEIRQAIYELAQGREICVGNEDKMFFLKELPDVMPLIVYAQIGSDRAKEKFSAIYFTNSKYERTGEIPIECDIKIEFSTKSDAESVFEAAMPVISLLSGFDITFFLYFDGVRGPSIFIPYKALPAEGKMASIRHGNVLMRIAPHLKRSMRMPGASCTIIKDPHTVSIMPYSIHPQTGLACIPLYTSELKAFTEEDAWLGNVIADNEWWNVPDDAHEVTASFIKQMAPLSVPGY